MGVLPFVSEDFQTKLIVGDVSMTEVRTAQRDTFEDLDAMLSHFINIQPQRRRQFLVNHNVEGRVYCLTAPDTNAVRPI
jgi:hypothetical protein